MESLSIGSSWASGTSGTAVRPHHVLRQILLLASHHQPLLILLLQQHELHLVVLERVVALPSTIALARPHVATGHITGVVELADGGAIGPLLDHGAALTLRTTDIHRFVGWHLGAMVLLEVSSVRGNVLRVSVWVGRDESLELVRIQRRWVAMGLKVHCSRTGAIPYLLLSRHALRHHALLGSATVERGAVWL